MLTPGTTLALTSARPVPPGSPDWLGSCGKTQLAVYLAESLWQSKELDLLVWVTATGRAPILSGYVTAAAAAMGIDPTGEAEAVAARFMGWLSETSRSWLVVLDGLSGPWDLDGLWPAGPTGRTMITTSDGTALFGQDQVLAFPVQGMSRREALSYLMDRLTEDRGQRSGAIDLVDYLGGEPLALSQASSVIRSSALSCRDYLDLFMRKRGQIAQAGRPPAAAISWTLAAEQADRLSAGGPVQHMLSLAALLDAHWIPGTIFTTSAVREFVTGAGARGPASPEYVWGTVVSLEQAGLLSIDPAFSPPIVRMSPAVQAAVRSATPNDMLDRAAGVAANALLEAWPEDEPRTFLADSLRSCASSVMYLAGDLLWAGSGYRLLFRVGRSLDRARLTGLAATHWSHVAAASDRFLGPGHPDALTASDQLAAAFLAAGRATEALPWFERVLNDRAEQLGREHPGTIAFELLLGRALLAAGRPREAVTVLAGAVRDCEHIYGADDLDTLGAQDALASACVAAGEIADGIRLYQRALAHRERVQGQTHPETMNTSQKLGDAYLAAERVKDALALFKRLVASRERTLGRDHPDTITARSRLAAAHHSAGRMATALRLYEDARADSERTLGVDHPDTLVRRVSLAHAYYAVGRIGDATALLRDTVERCERVLPQGDPLTQTVRESLSNIAGD